MKICKFVEASFIPSFDGASTYFSKIAQVLQDNNIEVIVIHCYRGWSDLNEIKNKKFKTYAIPPKYYYDHLSLVKKIIIEEKPDVIEMTDVGLINSVGAELAKIFKIPLVYDSIFVSTNLVTDLEIKNSYINSVISLDRHLPEIVSGVLSFTELDKSNLISATNLKSEIISVIPIGADTTKIIAREVLNTDEYVLFLGNMFFEPNAQAVESIIINIMPIILQKYPKIKFKFVGDCPENIKTKYENERCIFTGKIQNINDAFKDVRLCIAPIKVGGGMRVKVLTYISSGIPVVSSVAGVEGIPYDDSIFVTDDTEKFLHYMQMLLDDLILSRTMAHKARKIAEEKLSWVAIARKRKLLYNYAILQTKDVVIESLKNEVKPFWLEESLIKGRFQKKDIDESKYYILQSGVNRVKTISYEQ